MYPLVGEVDLHTVDVGDLLVAIEFLHLAEDGIDVGVGGEVNAVLGYRVVRIFGTQLTGLLALLCHIAQEEGYAYKGIAAIVTLGIDYSTVAFAANYGSHLLHHGGHVDLAHSRSCVLSAVAPSDVAQRTRR